MTNVNAIPVYHWYTAKKPIEGDCRVHWVRGKQYIRFDDEPSYEEIERYDLRSAGVGDMTVIGGRG